MGPFSCFWEGFHSRRCLLDSACALGFICTWVCARECAWAATSLLPVSFSDLIWGTSILHLNLSVSPNAGNCCTIIFRVCINLYFQKHLFNIKIQQISEVPVCFRAYHFRWAQTWQRGTCIMQYCLNRRPCYSTGRKHLIQCLCYIFTTIYIGAQHWRPQNYERTCGIMYKKVWKNSFLLFSSSGGHRRGYWEGFLALLTGLGPSVVLCRSRVVTQPTAQLDNWWNSCSGKISKEKQVAVVT